MNQGDMTEQMKLVESNNIIQNILRIPLIEIEQLNPRIRQLNGAMTVAFHQTGGSGADLEGTISYEYDWVGGEIRFLPNPLARTPIGTGKVAYIADDANDPTGEGIQVPAGALSGELFGWNRELLASHYGECYWKIVDPQIDAEIRDRYRSILINKFMSVGVDEKPAEKQANAMVADAVEKQALGAIGAVKVQVSRSSVIAGSGAKGDRPKRHFSGSDREAAEALRRENEELKAQIAKQNADKDPVPAKVGKGSKPGDSKTEGNLGA